MRLLVITQKVDKNDPILGFFHRWVEEFSKAYEKITVICLEQGEYSLPPNVKVLSLGKEQSVKHSVFNKIAYIFRFYRYIWEERKNYDAVFVHMNQEYVLLGWKLWFLLGKRIYLWRNHVYGSILTDIAVLLSNKVFCTSPSAYTTRFRKTKIMPAGIDTNLYREVSTPEKNSILFFGRLSPIKNVHIFIDILKELDRQSENFHTDIIGSAFPEDKEYEELLHRSGLSLVENGKLSFLPSVTHAETAHLFGKYALYVNLTPDGSLDKTMLEAMASGVPILISNSVFHGQIPEKCQLTSLEVLSASEKIKILLHISDEERKELGQKLSLYVENAHGLKRLVEILEGEIFPK